MLISGYDGGHVDGGTWVGGHAPMSPPRGTPLIEDSKIFTIKITAYRHAKLSVIKGLYVCVCVCLCVLRLFIRSNVQQEKNEKKDEKGNNVVRVFLPQNARNAFGDRVPP